MSVLEYDKRYVSTPGAQKSLLVELSGIVSASTVSRFDKLLGNLLDEGCPVVFDFARIEYLNSTSLSMMAEFVINREKAGRKVCFFGLCNDALRLVEMVGLLEVFPLIPTLEAALEYIDGNWQQQTYTEQTIESTNAELGFDGDVLLVLNESEFGADFVHRLFESAHGRVITAGSLAGVRLALADNRIRVAVVDGQLAEYHEICKEIKLNPGSGLVSIICLGDFKDSARHGYIIPPDEHLREPLDLKELSAVVSSEYKRREFDEQLFNREIKIELKSNEYACENGGIICEKVAALCNLPHHIKDSFFFAVREAIDNACVHGNRLDPESVVEVLILSYVNGIEVTVIDEGRGFDYSKWLDLAGQHDPVSNARKRSEQGLRGGLGISLMHRFCDRIEYEKPGNVIKLVKMFEAQDSNSSAS